MNITVSVVIPIYNMEAYAEECLKSVMSQSYKEIDIVAVNDGSTDRSAEIVEKLAAQDSRIRLFSKPNEGLAHTRNFGIEKATGEYILFLDCDDLLEDGAVEKMMKIAVEEKCDIVSGCITRFDSTGKQSLKTPALSGLYIGEGLDAVRKNLCIGADEAALNLYAKVYRKSLLTDNGISARKLVSGDDAAFALEAVFAAKSIYFANDVKHYRYRTNPASFTNKWIAIDKRIEYSKLFFEQLYEILDRFDAEEYKKLLDIRRCLGVYSFAMLAVNGAKREKKEVYADLRLICNDEYHLANATEGEGIKGYVKLVVKLAKSKKIKSIYLLCKAIDVAKRILK